MEDIIDIPAKVKQAIRQIDPHAQLILFGSYARGDARPDSDWDFLILLQKSFNEAIEDTIRNRLYDLELQTGQVISAVIEHQQQWRHLEVTPLYKNIQNEGIML